MSPATPRADEVGLALAFGAGSRYGAQFVRDCSQAAEAVGFHSIWLPEHIAFIADAKSEYPYPHEPGMTGLSTVPLGPRPGMYDPVMASQAVTMHTRTLHVGTAVALLPLRHPLMWARQIATVDHFSGGRFTFGVGVGWMSEEYDALGVPFRERGRFADECLAAIRQLWSEEVTSFKGELIQFEGAISFPKPVTPGGPPIYIGGESDAALRRTAKYGDGWYGWNMTPAEFASGLERLGKHMDQETFWDGTSRGIENLQIQAGFRYTGSLDDLAATVTEYRRLGAQRVVVAIFIPPDKYETRLNEVAQALALIPPGRD